MSQFNGCNGTGRYLPMKLSAVIVITLISLCSLSLFGQTPSSEANPSASETSREQFASQLSEVRGRSGESYKVSGDQKQVLEATVMAGSNVVGILSNELGAVFSSKGFESIHITLDGTEDEWRASLGSTGYSDVRSTIYCSKTNPPTQGAKLCLAHQKSDSTGDSNDPEARLQIAKALTEQAQKQGRSNVYSVCGHDGKQDGLCVVDPNTPEDKYLAITAANVKLAQMLYSYGFRQMLISNGKGGFWGSNITTAGFVPMREGSSNVLPDVPASLSSTTDVGHLMAQENSKALQMGGDILAKQVRSASMAKDDSLVKHGPPVGATVYHHLYIGEPLRAINYAESHCFKDIGSTLEALVRDRLEHACLTFSDDGHTLAHFGEFTTKPISSVRSSLVAQFGSPLPVKVRLLDTDGPPRWTCWRMKDGTYIMLKDIPIQGMYKGKFASISQVVVLTRWQEEHKEWKDR